jgi:hypothetical protein
VKNINFLPPASGPEISGHEAVPAKPVANQRSMTTNIDVEMMKRYTGMTPNE